MDALGAISSYILATQQLQMTMVKQSMEAEQQLAEVLLDASRVVSASTDKGTQLDISI